MISPRLIAKVIGDKERAEQHPFSFADPELTRVNVKVPSDYFVFSSFRSEGVQLSSKEVSQFVVVAARKDRWENYGFLHSGTYFELITPKTNPYIDRVFWESSVKKIWDTYKIKFDVPTDHLVFVDLEGPISGGPLGENVLGIFATDKIIPEYREDMQANLGWTPQPTSKAYVEANYPKSANQWEEYLFGTFAHEIGHLFFGFGSTREKVTSADDLWFSLGLGVIIDMDITNQLIGRKPQLEADIIKSWSDIYSKKPDIDQRLINPDKTNDAKYKFDRKKVFAHGKAAFYLERLREKVGQKAFDETVSRYLKECRRCTHGYADFKKLLPVSPGDIDRLEVEYKIR